MDDLLDEKGVIIATIQSLYKLLEGERAEQLTSLSRLTSCIIIDEAHHSVAPIYSGVLRKMGFNWRRKEVSDRGIVLIGLTATPFRGKGDGEDTRMLVRRYGGVYFPTIPYSDGIENYKPHALIDCPTFALAGEHVRILGERSYDRDGFIRDTDYIWTIKQQGTAGTSGRLKRRRTLPSSSQSPASTRSPLRLPTTRTTRALQGRTSR